MTVKIKGFPVLAEREDDRVKPKKGDLRVWWVSNPPHQGERYQVKDIPEAIETLSALAERDLALGDLIVCNTGGLEQFDADGVWYEFHDEEDHDIDDIIELAKAEGK